jgi:hypothetical protein
MTEPTRARLDAALDELAAEAQFPAREHDPAQLRHAEVFALAAIADELHEIRYLLWRATRLPGETTPADVDETRQRVARRRGPGGDTDAD